MPELGSIVDGKNHFEDKYEFYDEVLGAVHLNQLERDCVDAPEFQRLFRISQLGFVDLVYHNANHTRGSHSIGACANAKALVDRLNYNTPRIEKLRKSEIEDGTLPTISFGERCLISLAGLLHDLPHGPLSHDIEKKTHRFGNGKTKVRSHYGPYHKHDDFEQNPALYLMLLDPTVSLTARVLRHHSPAFWDLLRLEATAPDNPSAHLRPFVELAAAKWPDVKHEVLPALLFHLLVYEDLEAALKTPAIKIATAFDGSTTNWSLGQRPFTRALHDAWYQPYRHDIVGDTLSADLLDYLARDARRLGMKSALDVKLLEYYVLTSVPGTELGGMDLQEAATFSSQVRARTAIDLNDYKRGVIRAERINDVFRLLDFRHEIHEKAVFHRVVQSAIAMAGRAVALAGDDKPSVESLYQLGTPLHALRGDDSLLQELAGLPAQHRDGRAHHALGQKLVDRRVYRPLMIIPGDQAHGLFGPSLEGVTKGQQEESLRLLGAILDSTYFSPLFCLVCWCAERLLDHSLESIDACDAFIEEEVRAAGLVPWTKTVMPRRVILWTTPYKQLYKDPAIVVRAGAHVARIDALVKEEDSSLAPSILERLKAGMNDAESRYAAMWKVYVFISDGLYYTGGLARLIPAHPCRKDLAAHKLHLEQAQDYMVQAIHCACEWWTQRGRRTGQDLGKEISNEDLDELLGFFVTERVRQKTLFNGTRRTVSAVDVEQYLHDESNESCRDIRYRFDRKPELEDCFEHLKLSVSARAAFKDVLRIAGIDSKSLGHEEISDILAHIGERANDQELFNMEKAAREGVSGSLNAAVLRKIWLDTEFGKADPSGRGTGDAQRRSIDLSKPTQGEQPPGARGQHRRRGSARTGELRLLDTSEAVDDRKPVSDQESTDDKPRRK